MVPWGHWEYLLVERERERQKLEEQRRLSRELATREKSTGIFGFVRNGLRAIQTRRKDADGLRVDFGLVIGCGTGVDDSESTYSKTCSG